MGARRHALAAVEGVVLPAEIGIIPVRLTRPTVGLTPTIPQAWEGEMIEPSVSLPTANGARPAATAAPEPEEEPLGLIVST